MNLSEIEPMVKLLLQRDARYRDNDNLLVSIIWFNHLNKKIGAEKLAAMSANDFMKTYSEGRLPKVVSIVRARRRLQVEFPELRGANYEGNQASQEKYKEELKYKNR